MDNAKRISRDRRLLDIIESVIDVLPESYTFEWYGISLYYYGDNAKTQIATAIRALRTVTGGIKVEKKYDDTYFRATLTLPDDGGEIQLMSSRANVCRKVETGNMVTKEVPDYSKIPKKTITEPETEWQCDPILDNA